MNKLLYILFGFVLFNTPPLLADTPAQQVQQEAEENVTNNIAQGEDEDC